GRLALCGKHAEQRGLARAITAHEADLVAGGDLESYVLGEQTRASAQFKIINRDHRDFARSRIFSNGTKRTSAGAPHQRQVSRLREERLHDASLPTHQALLASEIPGEPSDSEPPLRRPRQYSVTPRRMGRTTGERRAPAAVFHDHGGLTSHRGCRVTVPLAGVLVLVHWGPRGGNGRRVDGGWAGGFRRGLARRPGWRRPGGLGR